MNVFAYKIIVTGRVQGVGFRAFSRLVARDFNIQGWVQNLIKGNVEIHAEVNLNNNLENEDKRNHFINLFCSELKTGNPYARVEHLSITKTEPKNYKSFYIK